MSSVVAIDLGSSCHHVTVSEKNTFGNLEYSPVTLLTDTGARSFQCLFSHRNSRCGVCDHYPPLDSLFYRCVMPFSSDMVFELPVNQLPLTSAKYQWDDDSGVMITQNPDVLAAASLLACLFIYEGYRCVKSRELLYDDMMTIVKEGWLDSKDIILTIPDRYGNGHICILQTILASCLFPSVSFVHSSLAASFGCFSLCNPKKLTVFLVIDIGSHSCKCTLFSADADHIKILRYKESFEISGDLADKVLYNTMNDSMDHVSSFSDAENASIYRTLNKEKRLFSETQCKEVTINLELENEEEMSVEITNEKYTRALKRQFGEPLQSLLTDLLRDMPPIDLILPVGGQNFNSRIISWVVDIIGLRQKKPAVSNAANKYSFLSEASWGFFGAFLSGRLQVIGAGASSGFWPGVSPSALGETTLTMEVCEMSESKQPTVSVETARLSADIMVNRMRKEEEDHRMVVHRRAALVKEVAALQEGAEEREHPEEVRQKLKQAQILLGKNKLDEAETLITELREKDEKTSKSRFIPSTYRSNRTNRTVTVVGRPNNEVRQASSLPVRLEQSTQRTRDGVEESPSQPFRGDTSSPSEGPASLLHRKSFTRLRRSFTMDIADGITTAEPSAQFMDESSLNAIDCAKSVVTSDTSYEEAKKNNACSVLWKCLCSNNGYYTPTSRICSSSSFSFFCFAASASTMTIRSFSETALFSSARRDTTSIAAKSSCSFCFLTLVAFANSRS